MLGLLLPVVCPACGRQGSAPCNACWRALRPAPPTPPLQGVALCRSLLLYDGVARELVARLKYRNARGTISWLASSMAGLIAVHVPDRAIVTWAPTSPARRRERGFDQAELLARAVARALRRPAVGVLRRVNAEPQTGRPAAERVRGVEFALASRAAARAVARSSAVVLVDDVITTGATIRAAAGAILNGRATTVVAVTAASTPLKLANGSSDG